MVEAKQSALAQLPQAFLVHPDGTRRSVEIAKIVDTPPRIIGFKFKDVTVGSGVDGMLTQKWRNWRLQLVWSPQAKIQRTDRISAITVTARNVLTKQPLAEHHRFIFPIVDATAEATTNRTPARRSASCKLIFSYSTLGAQSDSMVRVSAIL